MKLLNIVFGLLFFSTSALCQHEWTLDKEKDGIKLSSRKSATSSFNDIHVELDVPGSLEQLAAILMDIPKYTSWAYATKKATLIRTLAPGKVIYFSEYEVPWPATNRYFYANFELKMDTATHTLHVTSTNIPGYKPEITDLVPVPYSKGVWNVKKIGPKAIHIDYVLELNPGGSLPAWVINLFTTKGPMMTFENIKQKMSALNPGQAN
jgi:hypothetical protein